mmetsp:Transcript_57045/g.150097  ORF Transcript_57045/g.150097 Transcript_57045/m.150097 type:complete len:274 (+) Transcript_57045:332-1153(+)
MAGLPRAEESSVLICEGLARTGMKMSDAADCAPSGRFSDPRGDAGVGADDVELVSERLPLLCSLPLRVDLDRWWPPPRSGEPARLFARRDAPSLRLLRWLPFREPPAPCSEPSCSDGLVLGARLVDPGLGQGLAAVLPVCVGLWKPWVLKKPWMLGASLGAPPACFACLWERGDLVPLPLPSSLGPLCGLSSPLSSLFGSPLGSSSSTDTSLPPKCLQNTQQQTIAMPSRTSGIQTSFMGTSPSSSARIVPHWPAHCRPLPHEFSIAGLHGSL